jgi:hypothetical protein
MPSITIEAVQDYLRRLLGMPVRVLSMSEHGKRELAGDLKAFGYGTPLFLEYEAGGAKKQAVLETMSPSTFGHDHFSDRAQAILWEHSAFNGLPRHVRSLDSGAFLRSGEIVSTGRADEFFLLTEFIEGQGYFRDLDRMARTGDAAAADLGRALALSDYLYEIHARKLESPALYTRRIRDLLGHGECIMGLIDNYPDRYEFIDRNLLQNIESACVDWRWRIRNRGHRLCQVHGDFHPWNILFRNENEFTLLDRSRGEWGEPADDVTCLTINYLFSSLLRSGKLADPFEKLFMSFWDNYLERTRDTEMAEVAPPFYAWRGLVIGSPVWYPRLPAGVRRTIFNFILNVLAAGRFDHRDASRYLT